MPVRGKIPVRDTMSGVRRATQLQKLTLPGTPIAEALTNTVGSFQFGGSVAALVEASRGGPLGPMMLTNLSSPFGTIPVTFIDPKSRQLLQIDALDDFDDFLSARNMNATDANFSNISSRSLAENLAGSFLPKGRLREKMSEFLSEMLPLIPVPLETIHRHGMMDSTIVTRESLSNGDVLFIIHREDISGQEPASDNIYTIMYLYSNGRLEKLHALKGPALAEQKIDPKIPQVKGSFSGSIDPYSVPFLKPIFDTLLTDFEKDLDAPVIIKHLASAVNKWISMRPEERLEEIRAIAKDDPAEQNALRVNNNTPHYAWIMQRAEATLKMATGYFRSSQTAARTTPRP